MTAADFDTLTATKALRGAGLAEAAAEAIVAAIRHATTLPSVDHLATREQLDAVDKRLSARLDALQTVMLAGIRLNLAGVLAAAGFLYAVLKH